MKDMQLDQERIYIDVTNGGSNFQGVEIFQAVTGKTPSGCNHDNSCFFCFKIT